MADPVDFISILKDIRGNQFDSGTGLPTNGKWFDIKQWHTSINASAAQVALDVALISGASSQVAAQIITAESAANSSTLKAAEAATHAATSLTHATASASSAATSAARAVDATTQKDYAANWAVGAEDILVNDGTHAAGYSAYHWARKAQAAVGGVQNISDLADVPTLAGGANKFLRINSSSNAIEFITLTKSNVSLPNVDNTADVDKPISIATQTALNITNANVSTLQANTAGLSVLPALGSDPIRLQADKVIYSSAAQSLISLQDNALTTFALLKLALAAETIGTY